MTPLLEFSGRLRGLRRDALPQAPDPALRRPPRDRKRHGLLLHLRGNLPTTPYCSNSDGRGPPGRTRSSRTTPSSASGLHLAMEQRARSARDLLGRIEPRLRDGLKESLLAADQGTEAGIAAQRARVAALRDPAHR